MPLSSFRQNMIEQQIRTWDVLDEAVLALYDDILREDFVAQESQQTLAYADLALPIGNGQGQVMLEPKMEARMLQALALKKSDRVLHIGGGSGFFAALLGRLAQSVLSVEIDPTLAAAAAARLRNVEHIAVEMICGDGLNETQRQAPFDVVVLTGAVARVPETVMAQVAVGGRVLAVVGDAPAMRLSLFEKQTANAVARRDLLETELPLLQNAPADSVFEF